MAPGFFPTLTLLDAATLTIVDAGGTQVCTVPAGKYWSQADLLFYIADILASDISAAYDTALRAAVIADSSVFTLTWGGTGGPVVRDYLGYTATLSGHDSYTSAPTIGLLPPGDFTLDHEIRSDKTHAYSRTLDSGGVSGALPYQDGRIIAVQMVDGVEVERVRQLFAGSGNYAGIRGTAAGGGETLTYYADTAIGWVASYYRLAPDQKFTPTRRDRYARDYWYQQVEMIGFVPAGGAGIYWPVPVAEGM